MGGAVTVGTLGGYGLVNECTGLKNVVVDFTIT